MTGKILEPTKIISTYYDIVPFSVSPLSTQTTKTDNEDRQNPPPTYPFTQTDHVHPNKTPELELAAKSNNNKSTQWVSSANQP